MPSEAAIRTPWQRRCASCRSRACRATSSCPACSMAWATSASGRKRLGHPHRGPGARSPDASRAVRTGRAAGARQDLIRTFMPIASGPRRGRAQGLAAPVRDLHRPGDRGLEARGMELEIWSLRRPTDKTRHPVHDRVAAPVVYLPEYLKDDPLRVLRGWLEARRLPGYAAARARFLADLRARPDGQPGAALRPGAGAGGRAAAGRRAAVRALPAHAGLGDALRRHHARPAVEHVGARQGHLDQRPGRCAEKLADCAWLVTCTRVGLQRLARAGAAAGRLQLVYHGLDFAASAAAAGGAAAARRQRSRRSGGHPVDRPQGREEGLRRSAGRAGPAAARPRTGASSMSAAASSAMRSRRRPRRSASPTAAPGSAPSRSRRCSPPSPRRPVRAGQQNAADGDQDGLPNVLMEAPTRACRSSRPAPPRSPSSSSDGENGLLVPPGAPDELAAALERLVRDPEAAPPPRPSGGRSRAHALLLRSRRRLDRRRSASLRRGRGAAREARLRAALELEARARSRACHASASAHAAEAAGRSDVASGDREMARGFARLLHRLGHTVVMPALSRVPPGRAAGRSAHLALERRARAQAPRLIGRWRSLPTGHPERFDLWFTYHCYYRKPDWLGRSSPGRSACPM